MTAQDLVVGLLTIAIGGFFCFRGAVAMRFVIALWGAMAGFMLGAGAFAGIDGSGFLATGLGWVLGLVLALVFGALAYLFYAVAVILAMAAMGFSLGTTLMVALGVTWSWVIVLVGVALGAILAIITLLLNLPLVIMLVFSAFAGASAIVTGFMLLVGRIDADQFTNAAFTEAVHLAPGWYVLYLILAVIGIIVQFRFVTSPFAGMRDQWDGDYAV